MSAVTPTMRRGAGLTPMNLMIAVGPHQVAVDRILAGEQLPRDALADDHDLLGVQAIGVVEIAAGDDRHAERREEAGRDRTRRARADRPARSRASVLRRRTRARRRDRRRRATAPCCRTRPDRRRARPAAVAGSRDRSPRICSGVLPNDITGTLTASTPWVSKPGRVACSCSSVASSMPAPAISTNDAAICVTANIRSRRLVAPVMRRPPLDRPKPCEASAFGSRGTKARSAAASIARPTPTHSTLASSVRSSARTENRAA